MRKKQLDLFDCVGSHLMRDECVLDLYSGPGGLGTGFSKFFIVTVAVDHDRDACRTYRANHTNTRVKIMDVTEFVNSCTVKDFEIITGTLFGPPCQDFSVLNKARNPSGRRALELDKTIDAILTIKPEFALIENVRSVPRWKKDEVVLALERGGYKVVAKVVQAYDYGSVQKRPRWILTACKTRHIYPSPLASNRTAREILTNDISEMKVTPRVLRAIQSLPVGKWSSLPGSTYKAYFIIDPDAPVPAVVNPTKLRYIKPDRSGYLSMKEMANAQGFPRGYILCGTLTSIGQQLANAVPVELAERFAKEFSLHLNS